MVRLRGVLGTFEHRFWAALAAEARAEGLPACIVFSLPRTVDIMRRRGRDVPTVATLLLPAWRCVIEYYGARDDRR